MAVSTYYIKARPPIVLYGIGAVLAVLGAGLLVASGANGWGVLAFVGGVLLLGVGVLGASVAYFSARKLQVSVALDDRGYSIRDRAGSHTGKWSEVTKVTQGPGRLTFHNRDGSGFALYDTGRQSEQLDALAADISDRLDRDRGYGGTLVQED